MERWMDGWMDATWTKVYSRWIDEWGINRQRDTVDGGMDRRIL